MGRVSVGDAISEGFRLIGRAPVPVLLWGFLQTALAASAAAVVWPVYAAFFAAARAGAGAADPTALSGQLQQIQGVSLLIDLLEVVVFSVVYCAAFRAVLYPDRSAFGYMRLGMAELFFGALLVGGYFAFSLALLPVAIIFGIVIGILAALHQVAAAVVVGGILFVALMAAAFYVLLRLAVLGPMIVDDGKFHFADAWRATRGHVLSLLLVGLVLAVIALVSELVAALVLVALGVGGMAAMAGGLQQIPSLFTGPPSGLVARLSPLFVIAAIIWVPYSGSLIALMCAPWARAYRDLKPPDVAAAFI